MTRALLSLLALLACLLPGCGSSGGGAKRPSGGTERFAGHWTMSASVSVFTTLDGRNYSVFPEDMPVSAFQFISSTPPITDADSPSGEMWSVYMEVNGQLLSTRPGSKVQEGQLRLHATEVLRIDRARPDFLAKIGR